MVDPAKVILVTDLDNTLYDFAGYFAPCLRAMVHTLAPRLRIEERELLNEFREAFQQHGSLEYQFVVQELPSVRGRGSTEIQELVHAASVAFGRTRRRRLKLYPKVAETLRWAKATGALICAATNAPVYQAYRRLRDLGLLGTFSMISSRDGMEIPAELPIHAARFDQAMETLGRKLSRVRTHPSAVLKPNPDVLLSIIEHWGASARYFSIGDSVEKDLMPSHLLGMTTIWARYGTTMNAEDKDLMLYMTPTPNGLAAEPVPRYVPDFVVDDFGELQSILPLPRQMLLL